MKYTLILLLMFMSLLSGAKGASLTLPLPTGSYSVGTKTIKMRDSTRQMFKDKKSWRWMMQAHAHVLSSTERFLKYF